ncbi:hypothetical protein ACSHWO_31090 [Streptomyces sp. HUAS TT3]|uniref:hypothetical protein n=1 Tax=Streptomyces sp. HUAS TT3 TaxID=3447510 RepID=UPI003F65A173
MSRTSRSLRLVLFTASASLAAGGALLPTGAVAAPAAPHAVTLPADRGGNDHDNHRGKDRNGDDGGSQSRGTGEGEEQTSPKDSESGVVPESHCNDPKALPGLCVDGKPLPKGDGTVKVPQGSVLCLGIDTPEQCAARQKPVVHSPTGSPTAELAV